jgi:hypothetical protein
MTTKFKASSGARFGDKKAQIYAERLVEISKKRGEITPPLVLKDAKNPKSPLHSYFEWDNTKAAEKWRIAQAGELIRHIDVEVIKDDGKTEDIRYFFSVQSDESTTSEPKSVYVSLNTIMTDSDKRAEVIAYAKRELLGWKERYQQYSELSDIVEFIKTHA